MLDELAEILKIKNIFSPIAPLFIVPFVVIIAKTVITNLIEEYTEAKQNEIYSKF